MTTKEKIAIMQAWLDNKPVQAKRKEESRWWLMGKNSDFNEPSWEWETFDYRIKPEPMEIEVWVSRSGEVDSDAGLRFVSPRHHGYTKKRFREVIE